MTAKNQKENHEIEFEGVSGEKMGSDQPQGNAEQDRIVELEQDLIKAQEKAKIALADYQNLIRRSQEERIRLAQMAGQDFAESLLPPLQNLNLAAQALNDQGLNMVIGQLWQALNEQGLEEMNTELVGQEFDVDTMEAIEKNGEGEKVQKVITPGYKMNGKIIAHAKVVVG